MSKSSIARGLVLEALKELGDASGNEIADHLGIEKDDVYTALSALYIRMKHPGLVRLGKYKKYRYTLKAATPDLFMRPTSEVVKPKRRKTRTKTRAKQIDALLTVMEGLPQGSQEHIKAAILELAEVS